MKIDRVRSTLITISINRGRCAAVTCRQSLHLCHLIQLGQSMVKEIAEERNESCTSYVHALLYCIIRVRSTLSIYVQAHVFSLS